MAMSMPKAPMLTAEQLAVVTAWAAVTQIEPSSVRVLASLAERSKERRAEEDSSAACSPSAVPLLPQSKVEVPEIGQTEGDASVMSSEAMVAGRPTTLAPPVPPVAGDAITVEVLHQAELVPADGDSRAPLTSEE
jgi:hypothetical protein